MPYWDVQHNKQIQNNVSKEESQNSIGMQMQNGFENTGGKETPDSVKTYLQVFLYLSYMHEYYGIITVPYS